MHTLGTPIIVKNAFNFSFAKSSRSVALAFTAGCLILWRQRTRSETIQTPGHVWISETLIWLCGSVHQRRILGRNLEIYALSAPDISLHAWFLAFFFSCFAGQQHCAHGNPRGLKYIVPFKELFAKECDHTASGHLRVRSIARPECQERTRNVQTSTSNLKWSTVSLFSCCRWPTSDAQCRLPQIIASYTAPQGR